LSADRYAEDGGNTYKAGALIPYSWPLAGREEGVKALPFLTGFTKIIHIDPLNQIGHFITIEQKLGTFL
jgi:hypothetical protein